MVARADWCYNITWVAQETVEGWGSTFNKGSTYHIPYGQPIMSGKYIGYAATYEEFLEAAATAGSIFYTGRSWCDGPTAPYYATDCSSFVSWVWGIDRTTTYYIPDVTSNLGSVTTDRATYTLQLGDTLNSASHVVMVTGLEYDSAGAITRIEITEQTPPQMKRSYYSPSQLYNKYSRYTIQRYYGDVPTCPGVVEETWIEKACFDPWVYKNRYDDLKNKTDEQLKEHWLAYGIKEGIAGYDSAKPTISDVTVTDISAAGYTITCKVTDNWGPSKVAFPTWTVANANTVSMVKQSNGTYWAQVEGIAAKAPDSTYYVAATYTDTAGNHHCTGVIAYSLSKYCMSKTADGTMGSLAQATAGISDRSLLYWVASISMPWTCFISRTAS